MNKIENNTEAKPNTSRPKYAGWYGFFRDSYSHVINAGTNKAGERILKIRVGRIVAWQGWSGGCRPVFSYASDPIWVKASEVKTKKQIEREGGEPFDW